MGGKSIPGDVGLEVSLSACLARGGDVAAPAREVLLQVPCQCAAASRMRDGRAACRFRGGGLGHIVCVPSCENPVPKAFASMFVGNVARQVDATEFGDQVVAETLLIRRQVVELGKL